MDHKQAQKYRWFYTQSGKLVYGGKSAEQNEELVGTLLSSKDERYILHTKLPGSPFAIIDAPSEEVTEDELKEVAVWTASFSQGWKANRGEMEVDVFKTSSVRKSTGMPAGTFGVKRRLHRFTAPLRLTLINQRGSLRAVPEASLKPNNRVIAIIIPGGEEKESFAATIAREIKKKKEEVLQALPSGSFQKVKG